MTKVFTLLLLFIVTHNCFAWGPTGHRVVGEVATSYLSEQANEQLKTLLANQSLAEVSTWADEIRSDSKYNHYSTWHYTNHFKDGKYKYDASNKTGGYLIQAINEIIGRLKKKKATAEDIKLLVHFIGDLHQPFHVGRAEDKGGNTCLVKWFNKRTNLHAVWDSEMIEGTKLSFSEYAKFLNKSENAYKNLAKGSPLDWATESHQLFEGLYPDPVSGRKGSRDYCKGSGKKKVPSKLMPSLGYKYAYDHKKVLDERLLRAGVRLAFILNQHYK